MNQNNKQELFNRALDIIDINELLEWNTEQEFKSWVNNSLTWLNHIEAEENVKNILISLPLVRC